MSKEGYYQGEFEHTILSGECSVWWDHENKRWRSVFTQKFVSEDVAEEIVGLSDSTVGEMKKKRYDLIGREI